MAEEKKSLHLQLITLAAVVDFGGGRNSRILKRRPAPLRMLIACGVADFRGFFLRAIFFSTEEERGGIAALAGQRNADRVCDSAIVKVEF